MQLIKPSFKILEQKAHEMIIPADMITGPEIYKNELLNSVYRQIELAGRTCYKSEDKITEDSAKPFVDRMIKSKHLAMCEHGTLYLKIPANIDVAGNFLDEVPTWTKCKLVESQEGNWWAVTTNLRVMIEHFASEYIEELIKNYLCEPTEFHERRITVHFTADAGVMREFFRHRVFSMAQESTRYCNYIRDRFGNSITVVYPEWLKEEEELEFEEDMRFIEELYFKWLKKGWSAQQARVFLPLGIKAEAVMTGFVNDWKHFFSLRAIGTTGAPHPQAKELAEPLMQEFIERGYLNGKITNKTKALENLANYEERVYNEFVSGVDSGIDSMSRGVSI